MKIQKINDVTLNDKKMKRLLITIGLGVILFSCNGTSEESEFEPIDPGYTNPVVDPGYGNSNK